MSEKMSIAEFAKLVGTSAKTIYGRINNNSNLPVNEQLKTVNEKIKGREVTLIITDAEQIEIYKKIYGNLPVIDREYYENVTVNNGNKPDVESNNMEKINNDNNINKTVIDKLMKVFESNNDRILQLTNELISAKQKQLLLEDKASREGYYINENNELKKVITGKETLIKWLITVIITLLIVIITFTTYFITVNYLNNQTEEPPVIEEIQ